MSTSLNISSIIDSQPAKADGSVEPVAEIDAAALSKADAQIEADAQPAQVDGQASAAQPMKLSLFRRLKSLFRKINEPNMSAEPEEQSLEILLTPEELELKNMVTYFENLLYELYPYHPEHLGESNRPLVQVTPLYLGDPITVLRAEFFDGSSWSIYFTMDQKSDVLKRYFFSPTLEPITEGIEPNAEEEESVYSDQEHQPSLDKANCPTDTEPPLTLSGEINTLVENKAPAFLELVPKVLVQNRLKEMTSLLCIPSILYAQIPPDPHSGLGWIIEDNPRGVPVRLIPSKQNGKSDHVEMYLKGEWSRMKGHKRKRFLDDVARIQVSYASITYDKLGPLTLMETANSKVATDFDIMPRNQRYLVAKIHATTPTARSFLLSLSHSPFTSHLLAKAADKVTITPGPYPLSLPPDLISHVLVDPATGCITRLSQCTATSTVPWEFASLPPMRLSPRSWERWVFSLKRHYFGILVRNKWLCGGTMLFEVAGKGEGRVVWECVGEVLRGREEGWERMVRVVLGRDKRFEEEKRRWDEGIIV